MVTLQIEKEWPGLTKLTFSFEYAIELVDGFDKSLGDGFGNVLVPLSIFVY
jgi:hypothetical protein